MHVDIDTYTRHTHDYKVNTYRLYTGVKGKQEGKNICEQSSKQTRTRTTKRKKNKKTKNKNKTKTPPFLPTPPPPLPNWYYMLIGISIYLRRPNVKMYPWQDFNQRKAC